MTIHRSLRVGATRRNTLAACLAVALATGGAGAAAVGHLSGNAAGTKTGLHDAFAPLSRLLAARHGGHVPMLDLPSRPAGSVPVTTCADDGSVGSLREVIANAVDGDTIDLRALDCPSIALVSGEILVDVPGLSLLGPGADLLTIDGGGTGRVFASNHALAISDLTLANGYAEGGTGGCILVNNGDLALTRSTVTGCTAGDGTNLESYGGGIAVFGNLTMESSTVRASTGTAIDVASGGGAVAENAYLYDSIIDGNVVTAATQRVNGGGLTAIGSVIAYDTRVTGNSAQSTDGLVWGGGIFGQGGVTMSASTVSGNTVESDCADCPIMGGGAFAFGQVRVFYSTIDDNHVLSATASAGNAAGGGLATFSYGNNGLIGVVNSTVSGNSATGGDSGSGYGGGIAPLYYSPFVVANSTIAFNNASDFGGGAVGNSIYTPTLLSAIIAENGAPIGPDLAAAIPFAPFSITGSNSLVMAWDPAIVTVPADTVTDDPQLQPLADNGGPTATHAILAGTPAVDTGSNPGDLTYDQRGCPNAREAGAAADIGAFELQVGLIDQIFRDGFDGVVTLCQ